MENEEISIRKDYLNVLIEIAELADDIDIIPDEYNNSTLASVYSEIKKWYYNDIQKINKDPDNTIENNKISKKERKKINLK